MTLYVSLLLLPKPLSMNLGPESIGWRFPFRSLLARTPRHSELRLGSWRAKGQTGTRTAETPVQTGEVNIKTVYVLIIKHHAARSEVY